MKLIPEKGMNISDIAKLAGVSPSTVSRYLNNGYVSEKKKEIIRKVIEETGYAPNTAAQSIKTKKNRIIGVIVPKISSESISHLVEGINDRLLDTDYHLFLASTDNSVDREIEYLELFENNYVDGVILSATDFTKKHEKILSHYNKPAVIALQNVPGFPCVYNDDEEGAFEAVDHMLSEGSQKIAYLGVFEEDLAAGKARHNGLLRAHEKHGLTHDENLIRTVDFSAYDGYRAMDELLTEHPDIDGVFCATDQIAAGAINAIRDHHLRVPDDVRVAGVGDSILSKSLYPSLTTVHLYYDEVGREAADMLLSFIEGSAKSSRNLKLGCELCVRQSTTDIQPT